MKLFLLNIIIFLFSLSLLNSHKFYLTVADIKYNNNKKETKLIFKFFSDDLENSIQDEFDLKLYIGRDNEHDSTQHYINKYINKHFNCLINSSPQKLEILKMKIPTGNNDFTQFGLSESVWVYFKLSNNQKINSVEIESDLLMKLFSNNIVCNVKSQLGMKSMILSGSNTNAKVSF